MTTETSTSYSTAKSEAAYLAAQDVIAGGVKSVTQPIEGAEDDREKAEADLKPKKLTPNDLLIGIAASGSTPYTLAALEFAKTRSTKTAAIVLLSFEATCTCAAEPSVLTL